MVDFPCSCSLAGHSFSSTVCLFFSFPPLGTYTLSLFLSLSPLRLYPKLFACWALILIHRCLFFPTHHPHSSCEYFDRLTLVLCVWVVVPSHPHCNHPCFYHLVYRTCVIRVSTFSLLHLVTLRWIWLIVLTPGSCRLKYYYQIIPIFIMAVDVRCACDSLSVAHSVLCSMLRLMGVGSNVA